MKRIGALLLGSFVFLCALFAAGCTDTTELQQQIDELKASQAEIQALKDEINSLKSQIDTNNQEFQDQLNQATAKLATLEGKINGEPIEYLNLGDTASFVSNGIKSLDLQVFAGEYNTHSRFVSFHLTSTISNSDEYMSLFKLKGILYENDTKKLITDCTLNKPDTAFNRDYYSFSFSGNQSLDCILYIFSETSLFASYQIVFQQI